MSVAEGKREITERCSICLDPLLSTDETKKYKMIVLAHNRQGKGQQQTCLVQEIAQKYLEQMVEQRQHLFHGECLQKWLKTNTTCPLCRVQIIDVQPAQAVDVYSIEERRQHQIEMQSFLSWAHPNDGYSIRPQLQPSTMQFVLENNPHLEDGDRIQAIISASANGYQRLLHLLLSNGPISVQNRERAIVQAIEIFSRNPTEDLMRCVEELLENGPISEQNREYAIQKASSFYMNDPNTEIRLRILKKLLETGPISEKVRINVLIDSCRHFNQPAMEMLLKDYHLDDDLRGFLIESILAEMVRCINKENISVSFELVEFLLLGGKIKEIYRQHALYNVLKYARLLNCPVNKKFINLLLRKNDRGDLKAAVFEYAQKTSCRFIFEEMQGLIW